MLSDKRSWLLTTAVNVHPSVQASSTARAARGSDATFPRYLSARDDGSTVTTDYEAPFAFTGELEQVVVDVSGALIEDKEAEMRAAMAHQ